MKLSILSRFTASILFEYEAEANTVKLTLEAAVKSDADLRGADLRGANLDGEILSKIPLQLNNLKWFVLISDNYLRIGCRRYTHKEWENFTDEEIVKMDFSALKFWRKWKASIMALCAAHSIGEISDHRQ